MLLANHKLNQTGSFSDTSKTKDSGIPSTASYKRRIGKKVGGLYGRLLEILWSRYKYGRRQRMIPPKITGNKREGESITKLYQRFVDVAQKVRRDRLRVSKEKSRSVKQTHERRS